jgi:UDP-N-acetylmuramoyl-tripeptide--D-alanyl-D-alanine ligase
LSPERTRPPEIAVDDTVFALGELARKYRERFDTKIVAVTGSNGKTTVKNLIYEIISKSGKGLKSERNYNNYFGLPLSIFKLTHEHRYAVFELGMSATGEIARLAEIASPDIGMITNVGPAHLEFFDDVESIAEAKMEIAGGIRKGGALLLNGDDDLLMSKTDKITAQIITFGLRETNNVHPVDLNFDENQMPSFLIEGKEISSHFPGVHNVYNILAAFAAARAMGIDNEITFDALRRYRPGELRSEVIGKNEITFVIDCYNANPVSMKYAIDTLAAMKCRGRRIAVLGDMLELGERSEYYHKEIGTYANDMGVDDLFCYGTLSRITAEAFGEKGRHFEEKAGLIDELTEFINVGDTVLFKASRGIALEEVAESVMGAK